MAEQGRSIPEEVAGWSPHARDETQHTFFKYFMHRDAVVTLGDGSKVVTSWDRVENSETLPLNLPKSYGGE
jgi:hypothetical protein